jgi:hypothetical protein
MKLLILLLPIFVLGGWQEARVASKETAKQTCIKAVAKAHTYMSSTDKTQAKLIHHKKMVTFYCGDNYACKDCTKELNEN